MLAVARAKLNMLRAVIGGMELLKEAHITRRCPRFRHARSEEAKALLEELADVGRSEAPAVFCLHTAKEDAGLVQKIEKNRAIK
jgi:hypothetical protein